MKLIEMIDNFLNSTTMYRVVMYGLLVLALVSTIMGFIGLLPYSGIAVFVSLVVYVGASFLLNGVFSKLFKAPANMESSVITGLILFFIFAPGMNFSSMGSSAVTGVLACMIAIGSKYVLAFHKRHVFNPAAFAAVILGLIGNPEAVWWVGSKVLFIPVLLIGFMIVKKIRRFTLVGSFFLAWIVSTSVIAWYSHISIGSVLSQAILSWPVVFFAAVMLTEPLSTPPTQMLRTVYGGVIGVLFALQFHVGPVFSTPEFALVLGNVFSYLVSHTQKLTLRLLEKKELANGLFEFVFEPDFPLRFQAGQYIELTLPHTNPDSRGIRRYFTIASSPNERVLRFGVRVGDTISSFKTALQSFPIGGTLYASHLMGDFVLPKDSVQKLVFIAGGIGITPFRSMIQYLIDLKQRRDIVLLYACASSSDFAYMDVFEHGKELFGLKTVQIVTDAARCEEGFNCRIGYVDEKLLSEEVPSWRERRFYLSGPVVMVNAYKKLLLSLSIPTRNIVIDYFPGF